MKIYNQLAYKGVKFGTKKETGSQNDIYGWGCKLCCFATILQMDPVEVDKIFVANGVYSGKDGNLIDDTAAARALGWEFKGRDTNIDNMPDWEPTIKEVDFSRAEGKQQHFVVRMKESILDPYEGVERKKNFYEEKSGKFCSYRLFVVPQSPTPTPDPTDPCAALKIENERLKVELDATQKQVAVLKEGLETASKKISEAIKTLQ